MNILETFFFVFRVLTIISVRDPIFLTVINNLNVYFLWDNSFLPDSNSIKKELKNELNGLVTKVISAMEEPNINNNILFCHI